jgi:DNA-binding NarL/FixJ family response regulator
MNKTIRVIIVEDHPEFRDAVALVLRKETDMVLLKTFGNAELALTFVRDSEPRPDVVLLDLNLPGLPGLEAMRWFREYAAHAKIMVLTQSEREADVLQAIQAGAAGYLLKSATMDQIISGIRTVNDGGATLDANLAMFILKKLQSGRPAMSAETGLSKRELEVLAQIASGHSHKAIAANLGISTYTVTDHLKHIYDKLKVKNAPEAIHEAHRRGLLAK